ncbi:MAG: YhcH/YjgK/YiaL family protein [Ruminococcus flavefaciens]|nr:YhcH/YjgK/YiaL family protein [Ruminococcus flavefaciens]
MIYDKLTNISTYKGLYSNLDIAIEYLENQDLSELPMGRTEISGSQVFLNIMEASAAPSDERNFEIHRQYMDIQIDILGTEIIEIGDSEQMKITDYNAESDFGKVICPPLTSCTMGSGNFILCMAAEPHRPGIASGDKLALKKCVVKVHI